MEGLAERMRALALAQAAEDTRATSPVKISPVEREAKKRFNALVLKAKKREEANRIVEAVELYRSAMKLAKVDKVRVEGERRGWKERQSHTGRCTESQRDRLMESTERPQRPQSHRGRGTELQSSTAT
jgi:hypothetical protein